MRILGIDPGIGRMGWAVIEERGGAVKAIDYGCLETDPKKTHETRLLEIFKFTKRLIKKHSPEAISVEKLFFNKNVSTAMIVGEARGAVIVAATELCVPFFAYTPLEIKTAVSGYGKAEKKQVAQMVKVILSLKEVPRLDDTSDALAAAITHSFSRKFSNLK